MTKTSNLELLRNSYLSDTDVAYVYSQYPEARNPKWCPSCCLADDGVGNKDCDHELQRQLFKHYVNAGIPLTYQRISWNDYIGDESVHEFCSNYVKNSTSIKAYKENGIGLCLMGNNGIGKTTAICLLLKDLIAAKQKCFFTTYVKLCSMLGDSFYDVEAKNNYNKRILQSSFLAIDDIGKEMSNKLTTQAIDNILRERIQASRPTFITTNMTRSNMYDAYGKSSFSLLMEGAMMFEVDDDKDRRHSIGSIRRKDASNNIIHPIV